MNSVPHFPADLPAWAIAWRLGFLPSISDAGLLALKAALEGDDPRLIQGASTDPLPFNAHTARTPLGACAVCFAAWQGDQMTRVGEIEEFFAQCCFDADFNLGEPTANRRFLNWFDSTPRTEMRRALLVEVEIALVARHVAMPFPVRSVEESQAAA